MSTPTPPAAPQPPAARPATSPNAILACVLGVLAIVVGLSISHGLGALLAIAALVLAIVGLGRNEPQRLCAAVGILAAVFTFLV